jgi:hypothetical protein
MLMGGQPGREKYSVIGWPEPSLPAADALRSDDEDWEEGEEGGEGREGEEGRPGGAGREDGVGLKEEANTTDVIKEEAKMTQVMEVMAFDSAAECVQWYYLWAELAEMEKMLRERTDRAVKQLRDNKAGFASKRLEAEAALQCKAQGEALLQNQQV